MADGTAPLARLPKLRNKLWANVRAKTLNANKLRKASKRDTPEKPGTPSASQENLLDDGSVVEKKHIIINDEILALRIKTEDLKKLREPKPPSEERQNKTDEKPVVVRKLRPYSESHKLPTKTLVVARPAPPDARLRPTDCLETGGLRFDVSGEAIPHSILGSVDEYKKEAERRGELPLELYGQDEGRASMEQLPVKYNKPHPRTPHPCMESTDMTNALKNWTQKMRDRKRQQGYLSKLLNKPVCQLAMNQGQRAREVEETRYLIDRTLHTIDYGKGYRTGSEFWTQQEPLGDELSGLHTSVTQTLRGYPPPLEHVGMPKMSKQEAGIYSRDSPDTIHRPWHASIFLHRRLNQLGGVIQELDPHWPNIRNLQIHGHAAEAAPSSEEEESREATDNEASPQVMGQRDSHELDDPLKNYPDVHPLPVIGPSLIFNGQPARWAGNACLEDSPSERIEARIAFEAYATKRVTSFLEIVNDGTTAIYFDWVKVPKTNPFEMMTSRVQRFYFNTTSGVVLPGDVLKFPFVFKSPNAGVFSEQWHLQTQPMLSTGSPLVVTLRGVALQEDKYAKQRTALEQMLFHRQAEQIAKTILSDLLEGIRTPERPRSPIDSYITEEEIFLRKNPYLHYDHRLVTRLKELYIDTMTQVNPDGEYAMDDWDLDIAGLKQLILGLPDEEEEDKKQELLGKLNTREVALCFKPFTVTQQRMHGTCYEQLCDTVDQIVGYSMLLRSTLGLAERSDEGLPEDPVFPGYKGYRETTSVSPLVVPESDSRKGSAKGSAEKKAPPASSKAKPESKEKKSGKESKGGRTSKEGKELGGKGSKTPVSGNKKVKDSTSSDSQPSKITVASAGSINAAFQEEANPITEAKYREKLTTQAYQLLLHMADKMATSFEALELQAADSK